MRRHEATYEIFIFPKKLVLVKKVSIFLFFVMGICVWGRYPLLKCIQMLAKHQAESNIGRGIPVKDMAIFVNPAGNADIEWEEADAEFHYKGNMYDVVKKDNSNGYPVYYCYADKDESDIASCLEELLSDLNINKTAPESVPANLMKLLSTVFIPPCTASYSPDFKGLQPLADFYFRRHHFGNFPIEIYTPPPDSCLI